MNHISIWQESDLIQAAYCRQHNLDVKKFSRLKNKMLTKHENTSQFIQLKKEIPVKVEQQITIKINNRHIIELQHDFSPELLSKVLDVLESRL